MNMEEACDIVGYNASRYATRNMTKALKMFRLMNTGLFVLRKWKKYQQACNEYRDNSYEKRRFSK